MRKNITDYNFKSVNGCILHFSLKDLMLWKNDRSINNLPQTLTIDYESTDQTLWCLLEINSLQRLNLTEQYGAFNYWEQTKHCEK